ncbi:RNA polymerase sigma factor [Pseudonocardia xishanensis]|uniref:Sigma factor-like helix-turn-helix DNA-binding protein n=1 Tax=Pseudonocardia xishanensis TaxID=630995 RepID=A0ABP8RTA2_9PSEU
MDLAELGPRAVGIMARRHRDFAAAEDAVQEALLAAARHWPVDGEPDNPLGWLVRTAERRMTDRYRAERARREREDAAARLETEPGDVPAADDTLTLLLLCCHPVLTPASAVALTLRAVGGLSTAAVAAAFLVPEATMAQRISRAKAKIAAAGGRFVMPDEPDLASVLHVLYVMFTEGHVTAVGSTLDRPDLAAEAIRLTRTVHGLRPADPEIAGLLALMLLTEARRPARTTASGELVELADQDRARWDRELLAEGLRILVAARSRGVVGVYQLQASIAAVHAGEPTDWAQILGLYDLLLRLDGSPVVALNRAVAVAMVRGPEAGLAAVEEVAPSLPGHFRVDAVRGHLHAMRGDREAAARHFAVAAARTTNLAEQRHLTLRAARANAPGDRSRS